MYMYEYDSLPIEMVIKIIDVLSHVYGCFTPFASNK